MYCLAGRILSAASRKIKTVLPSRDDDHGQFVAYPPSG